MGEPLRHVMTNMGPIHLVDGNIQLQKCPIWWLLFHLVGVARGGHRLKVITTAKATKQVQRLKGICKAQFAANGSGDGHSRRFRPQTDGPCSSSTFTATTCLTVSNLESSRSVQQDLWHTRVKNSHNQWYREGTCTKMSHEQDITSDMKAQLT